MFPKNTELDKKFSKLRTRAQFFESCAADLQLIMATNLSEKKQSVVLHPHVTQ